MKTWIASLTLALLSAAAGAAEFPAVLAWSQRATLSTPVSGVVKTVTVTVGDRVTAGQVLLELDQRPFATALRQAKAEVHKHKLHRDEAERELERTRELYERTVISVHDLQLQEIAFGSAEADYAGAQAKLDTARLDLEYSAVHAPFSGLVLATPVTAGETVVNSQQATPLIVLGNDQPLLAQAAITAEDLRDISPGMAAGILIDRKRYAGKVLQIANEPDAEGRYLLAVSFDPGDDARLRAGLPARIEIN